MTQNQLFHDTVYDALGADISAAGGFKVVAGKLWPAESPSTATAKLRNSINPEQAQKLCPDEVMQIKRLAREAGSTATVDYEAQQMGYRVEWVDPADEADQLRRELRDGVAALNKAFARLESAEQRAQLQVVRK